MTDDDKRAQKGILLLEYQEAEQHLAHLQEKALRMSQDIKEVAKWLEEERRVGPMHSITTSDAKDRSVRLSKGGQYQKSTDFAAVTAMVAELRDAHSKIRELGERKVSLGVK